MTTSAEGKHTPGPWKVLTFNTDKKGFIAVVNERDRHIADVFPFGNRVAGTELAEHEANARLIAAAPDLLTALQTLVVQLLDYERVNNLAPSPGRKYCWDATERAVAALAKATAHPTDNRE